MVKEPRRHESLEQLSDRLERLANETLMLAAEIRRKANEMGEATSGREARRRKQ